MQHEQQRASREELTEEQLEIFDLLIRGRKLTKAEEVKVKTAAKNLYEKLTSEKEDLLVVDWYKDDQPKMRVKSAIQESLDDKLLGLPECYDKQAFDSKVNLLLNHFIDMSIQGHGWIAV